MQHRRLSQQLGTIAYQCNSNHQCSGLVIAIACVITSIVVVCTCSLTDLDRTTCFHWTTCWGTTNAQQLMPLIQPCIAACKTPRVNSMSSTVKEGE